jgi:pectate lyase
MAPLQLVTSWIIFGLCLASQALGVPTRRQAACEHCDDEAHGFASLGSSTTGGKGGDIVVAEPLIIRVEGEIVSEPKGFEIPIASNKTIIGIGSTAHLVGGGFAIKGTSNIILRNLEISDTRIPEDWPGKTEDWDGIQVDTGTNIWLDHLKVCVNKISSHL